MEPVPLEYTPMEVVEMVHERGCVAIVAHPFRNSTVAELDAVPFDAIEINGKHPRTRPLVNCLAAKRDIPLVGGSDVHYSLEVGRAYTLVDSTDCFVEGTGRYTVENTPATYSGSRLRASGNRRMLRRTAAEGVGIRSTAALPGWPAIEAIESYCTSFPKTASR